MLRLLIKFLAQAGATVWPLVLPVVLRFSFVEHFPFKLVAPGEKEFEPVARIALSLVCLAGVFLYDTYEYYAPRKHAEKFNKQYVNNIVFKEFETNATGGNVVIGEDVRINALLIRRPFPIPFRPRFFAWFSWLVWHGFSFTQGIHPDVGMKFLGFQGLSGKVVKLRQIRFADFRTHQPANWKEKYLKNGFWLAWWQVKSTEHLKYILCVPMLKTVKAEPTLEEEVVGVFNIDAVSDRGAIWLDQNRQVLGKFLRMHGKVLAELA